MTMDAFLKFEAVLLKVHEIPYMDYISSTFSRAKILTDKDGLTVFREQL